MKDKIKGLMAGLLIGSLITGGTVFAAGTTSIKVVFENLKYMVDGVQKKPTTGQGFIYNGTTYVPLRFAGEALGKEVNWDGKNKTIWIGKREGTFTYLSKLEYARAEEQAKNYLYFDEWENPVGLKFHVAGEQFNNGMGIILYGWSGNNSGTLSYNLNGRYKNLNARVGIDDYTKNSESIGKVTIYGDGIVLHESDELIGGDLAREINVDLTGVLKLEIKFENKNNKDQLDIVFVEPKLN
ncbi:hypothetical protein PA598K_03589 [Paenibacillus sp. 598K]|uniref:NPCBM/NEW2 domain-containing protein n=1 Tax=Paenibacillus sp. 598K TaxID=1117987 RepID=UPI000FF97FBE|nr:NPCBM/NEW2 domain-containing protein [Paenibacillus sp. 598K]GBF75200.1 hypothetical protein PA598K_03589 [Paenibacillus sp. 598K]